MERKRKLLYLTLMSIMLFQMAGLGKMSVCEASGTGKYFTQGKLYYHTISSNKVEVCATRQTTGTLKIPGYVTHKGKKYKVTRIADYTLYNQDKPVTEKTADGSSVAVELAGYHSYRYDRKDKKSLPANIDYISGSDITKVILPNTLTYIGEGAFSGCRKLRTVEFAKKYKKLTIGKNAFGGNKIKNLTFPVGTYELKENAAGTAGIISIPATVKKIGPGVVNAKTKKVIISKKNKNYKMKAGILYTKNERTLVGVSGAAKQTIKIQGKTRKLGAKAFAGTKVKKVILNNKITDIPKGAFYNCKKLVSVSGASHIKTVKYAAFANCPKLTAIGKTLSLTKIERAAFWGDNNLKLELSEAIRDIDVYAFSGTVTDTIVKLTVAQGNPVYSVRNSLLIKNDGNEKIVMMQMEDVNELIIPEAVTDVAVALGGDKCNSIVFPTTLLSQEGKINAAGGRIVYQGMTAPKLGEDFDIRVSNEKVTTILVPAGILQSYKRVIADVIMARDDYDIWDIGDVVIKEN